MQIIQRIKRSNKYAKNKTMKEIYKPKEQQSYQSKTKKKLYFFKCNYSVKENYAYQPLTCNHWAFFNFTKR